MSKPGFVYILINRKNNALYTGVTSSPAKRISEHKNHVIQGFTRKYNVTKLVYMEDCGSIEAAIQREKQIKGGSREDKISLITSMNPEWEDLSYLVRD